MLIHQAPDRLAKAGHLMPAEIDAASDLIGRAVCSLADEEFMAAVRQRAGRDSERLGR